MGTASRLAQHHLVSRRRTPRRKPLLRRGHHWPEHATLPVGAHHGDATPASALAADHPNADGLAPLGFDRGHEPSALDLPLATLGWADPLRWLAAGWRDFRRAPLIGLFFGACFVLMGWALLATFRHAPEYTLALSAGFLLMGPFLCLGLYEASRSLAQGQRPGFWRSLTAWRQSGAQLAIFAAVLLVLEMLWGRAAMIVFAISFDGVPDFSGPLSSFLTEEYITFAVVYSAVGALFAGLIYGISVISMPLLLDRQVDAVSAGLLSLRLVLSQVGVMLWWGALITGLTLLAMLPGFLGLLLVGPVLGHASWHAYRAALDAR
ncbi:MAG: DUF2189 domain-containing protein [Proteobacteria bacterium]|uniref:DUF2189 domain-containing protein n=1 Tax=Aquabacterium sp. TaxID=1872578 RepID=UPI0035C720F4|nr:DUF2189 domain-containing protein [Pseudomonadota bacterium]